MLEQGEVGSDGDGVVVVPEPHGHHVDRDSRLLRDRGRVRVLAQLLRLVGLHTALSCRNLRNWRANRKYSGFLPEERDWLTRVFEQHGFVDVFRRLDSRPDRFTWWSNLGAARERNVGWRIDYHIATPGIAALARSSSIYTRTFFSDHAPLIIDYSFEEPPPLNAAS